MNLTFHWINLLILFGALQGLIFCVILLFQKKHPGARFLAAFLFVLAYNGFETFNWSSGLDQHYMFFDLLAYIVIYGAGPSLYLYVMSLLYPERKISGRQVAAHYGLVMFQFLTRIAIVVYHVMWINKVITTEVSSMQLMAIVWFYAEPLSVLMFLAYLVASIKAFRKFKSGTQIKPIGKEGQQVVLKWINALLISLSIIGLGWLLTVLAPHLLLIPFDIHYYPIEITLVFFMYWMALNGYHKMKLIYIKPSAMKASAKEHHAFGDPAFSNSKISQVWDNQKYLERLVESMEKERMYLDPELNVAKLSSRTAIPSKTISLILNQYHHTSFNDFINGYRIAEVSKMMADPANHHYTISGIAFDAGFNSQATFQRAFKKQMGMSPTEYLYHHSKKLA